MLSDLIAAMATVPGRAALAVVRLNGRGAFDAARRVLRWDADRPIDPRRATLAAFHESDGTAFDRGLVTFFSGPDSYTGEDLVEFSSHGGMLAPVQLMAALQSAGARVAGPGEFTRRAVQNGKLDLLQAEAVGDLIDATTRAQGRGAVHQLDGGLSRRLGTLRESLLELLGLLSYDIDFPEEDDGPIDRARVIGSVRDARARIDALLGTAALGQRVRMGAMVVLAGRPNAGKSSLFNAMLRLDRALVTEVPGTTRDAIEADLDMGGWPVRLADTAGLRPSTDRIEQMGIEVSRRYLAAADLVLLCVEAGAELNDEERKLVARANTLLVRTKCDLVAATALAVSAETREGLGELTHAIVDRLFGKVDRVADLEPMLTRDRHRIALERAAAELADADDQLQPAGDVVLAAHHVRRAVTELDELVGVVDVDEVLGRVFADFCVGK